MFRPVAVVTSPMRIPMVAALATMVLPATVAASPGASPSMAMAMAMTGPLLPVLPAPLPAINPESRSGRGMVAVVRSPDADGACQEIVTRIVAELMADGVSVVALTCAAADPSCVAGSGARVSAIVLVQVRDNIRAVEVRSSGAAVGRLVTAHATSTGGRVQRVADVDTKGGPAALAVRTVEVLRAMLVDGADPGSAPAARTVARTDTAPAATVRARQEVDAGRELATDDQPPRELVATGPMNYTMSIGAAMLTGFDGLNNAYGPALNIGRRTSDHVMLSVALAGPAFGRDQNNAAGTVSVRHEMAALQADLMGLFLHRIVLRVGIAGGIYHVSIDGRPPGQMPGSVNGPTTPTGGTVTPVFGRNTGSFSGLLSWSAGVVANLRPDIGVFLDGRMFVLTPTPVVLLNGLEVGRVGNPQVSLTAGVEFRL